MRARSAVFLLATLCISPTLASTLTANHDGVMCLDATALARLTLPDGSSRSSSKNARASDILIKNSGGCIDIPLGVNVIAKVVRKNTTIVAYDPGDGGGARDFVVPNIDFVSMTDASARLPVQHIPAWPDVDYPPLANATILFDAVHKQCPQQGWNEHLLSHSEEGPWDSIGAKLTPAQNSAIEREAQAQCTAGLSCPADIQFGMEVQMGYLRALVVAICSKKAPPDW